jgi:Fe-Mn family superoxide dismutase
MPSLPTCRRRRSSSITTSITKAYVDNGNKFAGPGTKYEGKPIEDICKTAFAAKDAPVVNNIGQHYNHLHFWQWMKKGGGGKKLPAKLQAMVDKDLGGYDKMRTDFVQAGVTQFGSGWAWLAVKGGKLEVSKTPNGENPLMQAPRRSSASTCGSTAITSTTATRGKSTSRPGSTTW